MLLPFTGSSSSSSLTLHVHTSSAAFRIPLPEVSADSRERTFKDFNKLSLEVGERGELRKMGARIPDAELDDGDGEDDEAEPSDFEKDDGDAVGVSWSALVLLSLENAFSAPGGPHHL